MASPIKLLLVIGAVLAFAACSHPPSGRDGWLKGTPHEKLDVVAGQLRGFDMAMVEVGYRYQELYWAGLDKNWEYAAHQTEKIKQAIEYGLVRRPKRTESAEKFLQHLPAMDSVVKRQDTTAFLPAFRMLTKQCNACHRDEKVKFFTVAEPVSRQSPIRNTNP
jgi:hypothetical protein